MEPSFGRILRDWRAIRRLSQLDLALASDVSQKHLSFIELGRARPSREMIARLAEALDLPLRVRDTLLLACGFAPIFKERDLETGEMTKAREAVELILVHHEPYPAIVMNASWDIVMQNAAAQRILAACVGAKALGQIATDGTLNFMKLMFDARGLRASIANWNVTRRMLIGRLRRDASLNPGGTSDDLLSDHIFLDGAPQVNAAGESDGLEPLVPLEIEIGAHRVRLFSTFMTFGAPQDITLQELRIDLSFPADESSQAFLAASAGISEVP